MQRILVQLSDTHIRLPGQLAYRRVDTSAFLARAVAAVKALPQPADAVIVTGDLTDYGRADEYAQLRALLAPLPGPVYLMPGNHDDGAVLRRAFPDHPELAQRPVGDRVCWAVDVKGLRLVALDSTVPRAAHGELDDAQLEWLDRTLAAAPQAPTIVAVHHPPFATRIGHMDEIGLLHGADRLARVIARHTQVERLIAGHLHRPIECRFAGTIAMTSPSTAHQVALDLAADAASMFRMEPPGFRVHAWAPPAPLVTHLAYVDAYDGPHPFFDDDGELIDE
jgi:3',5'-cyclic AMP phosphodiesterase CpdA